MPTSNELFMAILAMDAYNRGYNAGINLDPAQLQIGNATLRQDVLPQGYEATSFFAQTCTPRSISTMRADALPLPFQSEPAVKNARSAA